MEKNINDGWKQKIGEVSLPEVFGSVKVPKGAGFFRKLLAFMGPGLLVAVGYMDPGNWATDLAGGSEFGYTLLSVILISNFMAMILQHLALKLGIVSGRDLAQACRDHYGKKTRIFLWILCEIAIVACDLAEVIGTAIALNLLFGLPLVFGVVLTGLDVMVVLFLQSKGFRWLEAFIGGLIFLIAGCFIFNLILAQPIWGDVALGLIPTTEVVTNPLMLYIAIGILGATVMPHNLYLHSSIVQTRAFERTDEGKSMAIKFATLDSTLALLFAFFINAAILILSAAAFYGTQYAGVADINDAYLLLSPVLGTTLAGTAFAVALLASGQNSAVTATLAGQIVMEGFLNIRLKPWLRRLITRLLAIVPAVIVVALFSSKGAGSLLVLSQVILSMQLSFAVFPLVLFTSDRKKMGKFANKPWLKGLSWLIAFVIGALNIYLLLQTFKIVS